MFLRKEFLLYMFLLEIFVAKKILELFKQIVKIFLFSRNAFAGIFYASTCFHEKYFCGGQISTCFCFCWNIICVRNILRRSDQHLLASSPNFLCQCCLRPPSQHFCLKSVLSLFHFYIYGVDTLFLFLFLTVIFCVTLV